MNESIGKKTAPNECTRSSVHLNEGGYLGTMDFTTKFTGASNEKDTNTNLSHNKFTCLKIVVSSFHRNFFISSEVIVFFAKTDFCHFYIHCCVYLKNHLMYSLSDYLT